MAVGILASVAAGIPALPVQNVGWTWTATVSVIQTAIIALLGTGGLWGLFRGIGLLWRIHNERQAQDDAKDAAIRKEMAEQNVRLTERIAKLEQDVNTERRRCDEEIADIRRHHADEVRDLRGQVDALQRMMIQMQISTGQVLAVPANAPSAISKLAQRLSETDGDKT